MPMKDLYNRFSPARVISPVAVGTTGTGQTGKIVDLQGYHGCLLLLSYGSITATNATLHGDVKEGDVTGTMTSVADADLLGTEALAAVGATASRVSAVSKNVVKAIGYIGTRRYVQVNVKSTVTAVPPVSVTALRGVADLKPVAH
jgi:hypothetical protein